MTLRTCHLCIERGRATAGGGWIRERWFRSSRGFILPRPDDGTKAIHFTKWLRRLHEACHGGMAAHPPPHPGRRTPPSTMAPNPERPRRRDNVISSLNMAIEALNLTKEILSITPAKSVCGSVSLILVMIRVRVPRFASVDCG